MGTRPLVVGRDREGQSLHDTLIDLLARYWHNSAKYNLTTNPGSDKNRWIGSDSNFPDLVGWVPIPGGEKGVWIAEVETGTTVTESEAREQWAKYDATGVPFYVVVPTGYGATARALAVRLKLTIDGFYEFSFSGGKLILEKL